MRRKLQVGLALIAVLAVIVWVRSRLAPTRPSDLASEVLRSDPRRVLIYRPGVVNQSRVADMDLKLHGQPLFPGPHRVRFRDCVVTGFFKPQHPAGPRKSWSDDLVISLRASGTPDGEWVITPEIMRQQRVWRISAGYERDRVEQSKIPLARHIPPGVYRADVFQEMRDGDEGKNEVHLLGTMQVTLLPDE